MFELIKNFFTKRAVKKQDKIVGTDRTERRELKQIDNNLNELSSVFKRFN